MEFLAGISVWVVGLGVMLMISGWILRPLDQRAKAGSRRMQFTLGDWICLIFMIQVWAAIAHTFATIAGAGAGFAVIIDLFGWVLVVVLWSGVVRRLSSAGVRTTWHRAGALVLVYPLNVFGAITAPALLWITFANLLVPGGSRIPPIVHLACALAFVMILGAMLASAQFVRTIVAAIELEPIEKKWIEVSAASGEDGQSHKRSNPEHHQAGGEEK